MQIINYQKLSSNVGYATTMSDLSNNSMLF